MPGFLDTLLFPLGSSSLGNEGANTQSVGVLDLILGFLLHHKDY